MTIEQDFDAIEDALTWAGSPESHDALAALARIRADYDALPDERDHLRAENERLNADLNQTQAELGAAIAALRTEQNILQGMYDAACDSIDRLRAELGG